MSLVSAAVQHCLTLKLDRIKNVRLLATSEQEYQLFQNIFWVIYIFEKPTVMRLGRSSVDENILMNAVAPAHVCSQLTMTSSIILQIHTNSSLIVGTVVDRVRSLFIASMQECAPWPSSSCMVSRGLEYAEITFKKRYTRWID